VNLARARTDVIVALTWACVAACGGPQAALTIDAGAADGQTAGASDSGGSHSDAATGGSSGSSSGSGSGSSSGSGVDAGGPDGASAAQKVCADNASAYCTHLQTCAPFLVTALYGDELTCVSRQMPQCLDALVAPDTGLTANELEACVMAQTALDCATLLYGKPGPTACHATGQIAVDGACRYDAQCGTGYCRLAVGASCGNCAALGSAGAPCTSFSDCQGSLMCAGSGLCELPSSIAGPCSSTQPCARGISCIKSACVTPGGLGSTCSIQNGGSDCDYDQGAYCDPSTSTCEAYSVVQSGAPCGGTPPTACFADGTCFQGACVGAVQDGATCNPQSGLNCLPPSSCTAGTCSFFSAMQCK